MGLPCSAKRGQHTCGHFNPDQALKVAVLGSKVSRAGRSRNHQSSMMGGSHTKKKDLTVLSSPTWLIWFVMLQLVFIKALRSRLLPQL